MEVKESNGIVLLSKGIEANSIKCSSSSSNFKDNVENHKDDPFDGVSSKRVEEVDILDCSVFNEIETSGCIDGSDGFSSSSFSVTFSETPSLYHQEADSMVSVDTSLPLYVRKKKLTDHWRRFVQPITWRCKWIELKIKEFQKQAQMYDKEVKESCHSKQLELENIKSDELGMKALPLLPGHAQRNRLMKRKKRERFEETSDVASYATNHNLFSYYECRKSFADIALSDNSRNVDKRNKSTKYETVFFEETPSLEFRGGDAYLEQLLLKIEAAKLEANNLKNRVEKVLMENPSSFFPDNTLNVLGSDDVFTSSEQQMPQLVIKTEDEKPEITEENPVKSASVSSHHDIPGDDEETTDIFLSEILASKRREGKGIAKLQKTEQTQPEEGSSRPARKRTPRNREVIKEENKPKRQRVSREKTKSNATMGSRFNKLPNRKRKRGKRRSASAGLRRRS